MQYLPLTPVQPKCKACWMTKKLQKSKSTITVTHYDSYANQQLNLQQNSSIWISNDHKWYIL